MRNAASAGLAIRIWLFSFNTAMGAGACWKSWISKSGYFPDGSECSAAFTVEMDMSGWVLILATPYKVFAAASTIVTVFKYEKGLLQNHG